MIARSWREIILAFQMHPWCLQQRLSVLWHNRDVTFDLQDFDKTWTYANEYLISTHESCIDYPTHIYY